MYSQCAVLAFRAMGDQLRFRCRSYKFMKRVQSSYFILTRNSLGNNNQTLLFSQSCPPQHMPATSSPRQLAQNSATARRPSSPTPTLSSLRLSRLHFRVGIVPVRSNLYFFLSPSRVIASFHARIYTIFPLRSDHSSPGASPCSS